MNKVVKKLIKKSNAGRPKESIGLRTHELFHIAQEHDCNPFEILIMFAKADYAGLGMLEYKTIITKSGQEIQEPSISPELQQRSAKDACEYLFPKRKAIEHTINPKDLGDKELIEETKRLLEAAEEQE